METEAINKEQFAELKEELLIAIENVNETRDWSWLLCVLTFAILFSLITFARKYLLTWVAKQTKKTDNDIDDFAVELIQGWLVNKFSQIITIIYFFVFNLKK